MRGGRESVRMNERERKNDPQLETSGVEEAVPNLILQWHTSPFCNME